MSHPEQQEFCKRVKTIYPRFFNRVDVLEVGSRNLNGTVRDLFFECRYVGIDCMKGKNVDVVTLAHEYDADAGSFDVVCSLETFEHDPFCPTTITSMLRLLRPGGLFFVTCASKGRKEHGTNRQQGKEWKLCGPNHDFYRNIDHRNLMRWLTHSGYDFDTILVEYNKGPCDLYCYGIKSSG